MNHKAIRYTAYKIFRDFGGLLAATIRFTALSIASTQGFSITNSLIKKLYSTQEDPDDERSSDDRANKKGKGKNTLVLEEEGEVLGLSDSVHLLEVPGQKDNEPADKEEDRTEQDRVKREIESRATFSYTWSRFYCNHRLSAFYCCCKLRQKRADFLFKDAKGKLNEEMDILEIVKKLRVHQFASQ